MSSDTVPDELQSEKQHEVIGDRCVDCGQSPADYLLPSADEEGPFCGFCAHERSRVGKCDSCGEKKGDVRYRPEHPNERLCKQCQRSAAKAMRQAGDGWGWTDE